MPPFFKDIATLATDILDDDYSLKRQLKVKHTTPSGVGFTTENDFGKIVTAKVSVKYAHPSTGFSLDKYQHKPDGTFTVETSVKDLAPGLKLIFKTDNALKGDIGAEYSGLNYAIKSEIDTDISKIACSTVFSYESFNAGAAVAYKFPGEKSSELKDYNAALSYGGPKWFTALTTSNKMSTYSLSAMYRPASNMTAAITASANQEKISSPSLTVGGLYKCNPNTTMRAKVGSDGLLSGVVSQTCAKKMVVNLTGQVDVKDVTNPKFGLTCTLG